MNSHPETLKKRQKVRTRAAAFTAGGFLAWLLVAGPSLAETAVSDTASGDRLGQLVKNGGASLPDGVDEHHEEPIISLPQKWVGNWTGTAKVVAAELSPTAWQGDALRMYRERSVLRPGREGDLSLTIKKLHGGKVILDMPKLDVEAHLRHDPLSAILVTAFPDQPGNAEIMSKDYQKYINFERPFGAFGAASTVDETNPEKVLFNQVKVADDEKQADQELVTQGEGAGAFSGSWKHYSENVIRLKENEPGKLLVTTAAVGYFPDGSFAYKYVIEGTLSRDGEQQ